jgi:hypothetical protein
VDQYFLAEFSRLSRSFFEDLIPETCWGCNEAASFNAVTGIAIHSGDAEVY